MENQNKRVLIGGKQLVCPHCGARTFRHREGQLNTKLLSSFGLDGFNKSADVLVCSRCGRLEWFLDASIEQQDAESEDEVSEPTECVACGETIPEGKDTCPKCGWTYKE